MSKKNDQQPELLMETPAIVTPAVPGDPAAEKLELIDDTPDVIKMDLRKFNKTKQKISQAVHNVTSITMINNQEGVDKMMLVLKEADGVAKVVEAKRKELGDPYRLEVDRINKYVKDLVKDIEPAIKSGKALILAFHESEKVRLKKERTEARDKEMELSGLKYFPEGSDSIKVAHYWERDLEMAIYRRDVEDATPETWEMILNNLQVSRTKATERSIAALEKQKDGADFFGETDIAAAIDQQIAEVRTAPRAVASYGGFSTAAPATKGLTKRWVYEITDLTQVPREYLQVDEKKVKEAIAAGARAIAGIRIYQDESISLR